MKNFTRTTAALSTILFVLSAAGADTATPDAEAPEKQAPEANIGKEVEIDLDALEEEASPGDAHSLVPDEPTLPVRITEIELNKKPWLALIAVVIAVPVVLMLIPPRRTNRRRTSPSDDKAQEKKEA